MPQEATPLIPFHVEHSVSRQHGGTDDPGGFALACDRCNAYKGPNLTSIDPDTGYRLAIIRVQSLRAAMTPPAAAHVEHIVSRHGGTDDPGGLALACDRCNAYKGPNLTSIDPDTGIVTPLLNPRGEV
jgi:hypothetical protein